jgi:AraC-like DNA-binding protein
LEQAVEVHHRIHRASQRLVAGEPIGEITDAFGSDDLFLSSRQFRDIMGRSPSAWRAMDGQ